MSRGGLPFGRDGSAGMRTTRTTDSALVRSGARAVGLAAGVVVAVVIAVFAFVVLQLTGAEQGGMVEGKLDHALDDALAGDLGQGNPLVQVRVRTADGVARTSPGWGAAQDEAAGRQGPGSASEPARVAVGGVDLAVASRTVDGFEATAVMDLREAAEERARLIGALALGGLVAVLSAAGLSWALGRRAVRPLARALATQQRFVADVSHELRTPLTILSTRAQLLQRRLGPDHPVAPDVARLLEDTRAMRDVVGDLLMSAELRGPAVRGVVVDVTTLAAEAVARFDHTAAQAGVRVLGPGDPASDHPGTDHPGTDDVRPVAGTPDTPDRVGAPRGSAAPALVHGVPTALSRALAALIDNAVRHTPAGGTVVVEVTRHGDRVEISVADDGEGLDPAQADRLLTRFGRGGEPVAVGAPGAVRTAVPQATDGEGPAPHRIGIGLSLVQEIVEVHRGTLRLDGALGAGATATLDLPAADPEPVAEPG